MKRNNCETSRRLNGNWSKKQSIPYHDIDEVKLTRCFVNDGIPVMNFTDKQMSEGSSILAYSCDGSIKINS